MDSLTKDLNDGLLKALQCPRCTEYMIPPISFCENGHNVCTRCKPKLNRCPDCKEPYLRGTNLALETVARQVEYPCKFRKKGCQLSFPVHLILDHQEECPFGPFKCPIILAGRRRCPWESPLQDLKTHLEDSHQDEIWEGSGAYVEKNIVVSPSGLHNNVMIVFDEIFYMQLRGENGNYYGFVKYIGPKRSSMNYKYKITISSVDGNEKVMASYKTNNFKEDNEEIIRTGKCLKLHYDVIKRFLDEEFSINLKIEVSEIPLSS